jgi:tetratricopeptide (TPR) repeat protein
MVGLAVLAPLAANANDIAEGQKLYKQGKISAAAAYFERASEKDGYDATAHYYLGNCFMALKNYYRAATEYQRAMDNTEDSKMEDYCRNALEKLKTFTEPKPAQDPAQKSESHFSATGVEAKTEKVQAILQRAKADAKNIMDRANERCKPIQEEKQEMMRQMNIKYRGRVETTTADERDETQKNYDRQIESIKHLAKTQADGVLDQARRDAASVGQGLPNLDELLPGK